MKIWLNTERPNPLPWLVVWGLALMLAFVPHSWAEKADLPPLPPEKLVDESFSFRSDENLYQFEEAVTLISSSLGKIADKVNVLAINSLQFGGDFQGDFRAKAKVIFLEKLLAANPAIKLLKCQECEKLETKIVRGNLVLRKGFPNAEARAELAKKIGVEGFLDIGMFREKSQIMVYLQVVEAKTGAVLLVEELAGRKAFRRSSYTVSLGDITMPIKSATGTSANESALGLLLRQTVLLSRRFFFGVDLMLFMDNNATVATKVMTLPAGFYIGPRLGYDILQFPESTTKITLWLAVQKFLMPTFNYSNVYTLGLDFVVGDNMEFTLGYNSYAETKFTTGETLSGSGMVMAFGYRW